MEDNVTVQPEVESTTSTPPIPPKYKLWLKLKDAEYYTKSYADFQQKYSTPEAVNELHGKLAGAEYYTKSNDDFSNQYFSDIKKKNQSGNASQSGSPSSESGSSNSQLSPFKTDSFLQPLAPQPQVAFTPSTDPNVKQQVLNDEQAQLDKQNAPAKEYLSKLSDEEKANLYKVQQLIAQKPADAIRGWTPEEIAHDQFMQTSVGKTLGAVAYLGSKATKGTLQVAKGAAHLANLGLNSNPDSQAMVESGLDGLFEKADKAADYGLTNTDKANIESGNLIDKNKGGGLVNTLINAGSSVANAAITPLGMAAEFAPAVAAGEATNAPKSFMYLQGVGQGKDAVKSIEDSGAKLNPLAKEALIQGSGAVNLLLTDVFKGSKVTSALQDKVVTGIAADAIKESAGKDMTIQGFKDLLNNKAQTFAQKLERAPLEILNHYNETAKTFTKLNVANFALHKGVDAVNDSPVFNENLGNLAENESKALTKDAPIFAAMPALGELSKLFPNSGYKNDVVDAVMKDPSQENIAAIKNKIYEHGYSKDNPNQWSQDEMDATFKHVDEIADASRSLPRTIPENKHADAVGLVLDRNMLQGKLDAIQEGKKALDPSIQDIPTAQEQYLTDKIEQANTKLRDIVSGTKTTYSRGLGDDEGKFTQTTGGKQEDITPDRYNLERTERDAKVRPPVEPITNEQETTPPTTEQQGENAKAETSAPVEAANEKPTDTVVKEDTIPVKEILDKPVKYNGEDATIYQDGQTLVAKIKDSNREYELGNVDEVGDKSIKELGIEHQGSVVDTDKEGDLTVRDKKYINNYSDPKSAINYDDEGNVTSVNLETPDGKKRTFRGDIAEDLAYQIHLKELNKDNGTKQEFEQFVEQNEPAKQSIVSRENEVIAEKTADKVDEPVSRKPAVKKPVKEVEKLKPTKINEIKVGDKLPEGKVIRIDDKDGKKIAVVLTGEDKIKKIEIKNENTSSADTGKSTNTGAVKEPAKPVESKQAPKEEKVNKYLTDEEVKRKAELRKKFAGRFNDITSLVGMLADKDFMEYAGLIFKEAKGEFKDFSSQMVDELGDKIKEHLPGLFKAIDNPESVDKYDSGYEQPEMIEANNAYMDAKVEGKFGQEALDGIISKLKDTNLENIVKSVKEKIKTIPAYLERTRDRVLTNGGGSEQDQAALLMDQYNLKAREESLINAINESTDESEIKNHQEELFKLQGDILDNATANRMIGREASTVFRLRQVAVDKDANLDQMRLKFMATEGLKKLTSQQEEYIKQKYQEIREAEVDLKKIRDQEAKSREENERLKSENDAYKKIIDTAKRSYAKKNEKASESLARIRKDIDNSKSKIKQLVLGRATSLGILNPDLYIEISKLALKKAEEAFVKTKTAIELNSLVKDVIKEIKDVAPEITEKDVRDAISGNYKREAPKLKTDLQKNIDELKREAGLINKHQDLIEGKEPEKKSANKPERSEKIKELEDAIKKQEEINKNQGLSKDEVARLKQNKRLLEKLHNLEKGEAPDRNVREADRPIVARLKQQAKEEAERQGITAREWNKRKLKETYDRIREVQSKLDKGEFTTPEKEAKKYEKSDKLKAAERELAIRKFQWEKERKQALLKNRSVFKKVVDNILAWQRFSVLSYPSTIVKLVATALQGVALKPIQLAFQELQYRILPKSITGDIGGHVRAKAIAKYYSAFIRNFAWSTMKKQFSGIDEADILYGSPRYEDNVGIGNGLISKAYGTLMEIPGRSHGYIKSFLKAPETAFAHEQLLQGYIEKGQDIQKQLKDATLSPEKRKLLTDKLAEYDLSDDNVIEKVNMLAAAQGRWAILMNDNHVVEKFRGFMGQIGILGDVAKSEVPILKIPMNYFNRYFMMKLGLIQAITGKKNFITGELETPGLIHIALKGSEDMTDQQKEVMSRLVTYGSMGASAFALGYFVSKKVKHNDDGSVDIDGHHISKLAVHNPLVDNILSGVETAQRFHKGRSKEDAMKWIKSYAESDIDVIKKMPFSSQLQYGFLTNVVQGIYAKKDETMENKLSTAIDKKIADMITPGFIKEWATMQDKTANGAVVKRKPKGLWDTIKLGFPVLRKTVHKK